MSLAKEPFLRNRVAARIPAVFGVRSQKEPVARGHRSYEEWNAPEMIGPVIHADREHRLVPQHHAAGAAQRFYLHTFDIHLDQGRAFSRQDSIEGIALDFHLTCTVDG